MDTSSVPTPFQLFQIKRTELYENANHSLSFLEISRKVAYDWYRMPEQEKMQYYDKRDKLMNEMLAENNNMIKGKQVFSQDNKMKKSGFASTNKMIIEVDD